MMLAWAMDWDKVGTFVQVVGVPFACLLLFTGPFIWIGCRLFKKYGEKLAESHIAFLQSAATATTKNAETLERLEVTMAHNQNGHAVTHKALTLVTKAGLHVIEGDHSQAKNELAKVDIVLSQAPPRF